jgi:hypothetical protein
MSSCRAGRDDLGRVRRITPDGFRIPILGEGVILLAKIPLALVVPPSGGHIERYSLAAGGDCQLITTVEEPLRG